MLQWNEFRLWYADPNQNDIFEFKKKHFLPILAVYEIEDFLILDEPYFILLRVNIEEGKAKQIFLDLEKAIRSTSLFARVTREGWSPVTDAKDRVLSAGKQLNIRGELPEGWVLETKDDGTSVTTPTDLDKLVTAFSVFMSKVAGKFTEAYLREMPYRVEDTWLKSVFIHLLLDSISTSEPEEVEARRFPCL